MTTERKKIYFSVSRDREAYALSICVSYQDDEPFFLPIIHRGDESGKLESADVAFDDITDIPSDVRSFFDIVVADIHISSLSRKVRGGITLVESGGRCEVCGCAVGHYRPVIVRYLLATNPLDLSLHKVIRLGIICDRFEGRTA